MEGVVVVGAGGDAVSHASKVYLVNASHHVPAHPSGMENLQTLFGLDSLAASVARVDAEGNKIVANKLNKTYKKQIVDLDVPGGSDIPKNRFLMDALLSGAAQVEVDGGRVGVNGGGGGEGYRPFSDQEIREAFDLRPGPLHGYVRYQRPPSPSSKRGRVETTADPLVAGPSSTTLAGGTIDPTRPIHTESRNYVEHHHHVPRSSADHRDAARFNNAGSTTRGGLLRTPSPPTTRSIAYAQAGPGSSLDAGGGGGRVGEGEEEGESSEDDGSRFKQLERERKRKLRLKREAERVMGGDYKRRRYDIDGYEFLDSD